jgi:hypothetical protein
MENDAINNISVIFFLLFFQIGKMPDRQFVIVIILYKKTIINIKM